MGSWRRWGLGWAGLGWACRAGLGWAGLGESLPPANSKAFVVRGAGPSADISRGSGRPEVSVGDFRKIPCVIKVTLK